MSVPSRDAPTIRRSRTRAVDIIGRRYRTPDGLFRGGGWRCDGTALMHQHLAPSLPVVAGQRSRKPNRSGETEPCSLGRHEATSRRSRVDLSPVRRHRSLRRRHGSGRVRVFGGLLVQTTGAESVSLGVPLRPPGQPGVRIASRERDLSERRVALRRPTASHRRDSFCQQATASRRTRTVFLLDIGVGYRMVGPGGLIAAPAVGDQPLVTKATTA